MRISRYAFVVLLLGVLSFVSCDRKVSQDEEKLGVEVLLKLTDPEEVRNGTRSEGEAEDSEDYGFYVEEGDCWFGVSTRAISAVSTLANSNVVWGAYTPSGVWSPSRVTTNNSGVVSTGHYCASSGTTNNTYYVTNVSNASNLSINSTAGTITVSQSANSGTDIVAGWASSTSSNVSVTVKHVYARTGSLSFSAPSGASVSNVTWSLKSHDNTTGTSGTYNIRNDTWSSSGQLSATSINSSSDLYLIPGQYDVTVSFRLTQGSVTRNLSRTGTVTLERGKINNISAGINNRHELILSPASATINRGATQAYSVTLRTYYVMGSTDVDYIDTSVSNSSCTWSSSNTSVATVSNGTATGVSSGSSTITARYTPSGGSQQTATATLTVQDVIDYVLVARPSSVSITVGSNSYMHADVYRVVNGVRENTPVASGVTVTNWTSTNTSVATVDPTYGTVTGVSTGTVYVYGSATYQGQQVTMSGTDRCQVTVTPRYELEFYVPAGTTTSNRAHLAVGVDQTLTVRLVTISSESSSGRSYTTLANSDVTWSITAGNPSTSVVTLSSSGVLHGVSVGTANITARYTVPGTSTQVSDVAYIQVVAAGGGTEWNDDWTPGGTIPL